MYHFRPALATALAALALGLVAGCATPSAVDRALAQSRQAHDDEAIRTLRQELAVHPDNLAARRLLVRLYAYEGDVTTAEAEAQELKKRSPAGDPQPYIELGHAYELAHRFEEALAAYDEAASFAPTSPLGPREGGMRCARWGEIEEARPRLEEAVRRGARDAETWHALGLVRVHLQDLDGAEEAYRAGAAADPNGAENLLGLATVAVLRDDPKAGLAAYTAILSRRPRFAPAELGRAWALAKLGRRDEAAQALDHAEELGAPSRDVERQRRALTP